MKTLILAALLGICTNYTSSTDGHAIPAKETFAAPGVEVLNLEYEMRSSDVAITLILQVDATVLSITSVSYNYVEASEQLNNVIKDLSTNQNF